MPLTFQLKKKGDEDLSTSEVIREGDPLVVTSKASSSWTDDYELLKKEYEDQNNVLLNEDPNVLELLTDDRLARISQECNVPLESVNNVAIMMYMLHCSDDEMDWKSAILWRVKNQSYF